MEFEEEGLALQIPGIARDKYLLYVKDLELLLVDLRKKTIKPLTDV